jgi:DNA-binding GntR family transcriptional regulator
VKSMSQPGRVKTSIGEIGNIIKAVERRDAKAAARHAVTYVNNACAAALERLDAEPK